MKFVLSFLCCFLFLGSARAQPNLAYEEATKLYKLQEYEAALLKFQEAYQSKPSPELLFNIAQCYRLLNRYEEAIRAYRNVVLDSKDGALLRSANDRIKELEDFLASVGSIQISSSKNPAQVYIDGIKKNTTPLVVNNIIAGPHVVRVEKQGYLTYEEKVQIEAKQTFVLQASLLPEKQPPTYLVPALLGGASAVSGASFLFLFVTRDRRDDAIEGKTLGLLSIAADVTLVGSLASGVYVGIQRKRSK